jgi:undecaprenyl-diphosphatase
MNDHGGRRPSRTQHRAWIEALLDADARLLRRIHGLAGGSADGIMRAFTWLGNHQIWWAHTAAVALFVGLLPAALLGGGSGAAAVVAQGIKRSVRRRRPDAALLGFEASSENPDRFSFPSGHTCGAFGGAVALAFVSPPVAAAFGVLAVGIAFSRMYLGAHYPLDVAVGALVGVVSGWVSAHVILAIWPELVETLALPASLV